MSTTPPEKGGRRSVRIGRYEVIRHLATGGMGAVYRAYDPQNEREVALKVIAPQMAANPKLLERFQREAQAAGKLKHENIVEIYEWGEATGTHYLAMEFVDGVDLYNYINEKGQVDPEEARQLLIQAARALEHAHQQGIVHRDIKPSNFLLTQQNGRILLKLTDLGLARQVNEDLFRLTTEGTTVGTIDYMAPEQARNSDKADIRSDIYALGCTFFHMLAGRPPFPEGGLTERIMKHVEAPPPDICALNPAVSPALRNVLLRMLAKKPGDRFQTPALLLAGLEDPEAVKPPPVREKKAVAAPANDQPSRSAAKGLPFNDATLPAQRAAAGPPGTQKLKAAPTGKPASSGSAPAVKAGSKSSEERVRAAEKKRDAEKAAIPPWLPWVGGGSSVALVLLLLFLFSGSGVPPEEDDKKTLAQTSTRKTITPVPPKPTTPEPVVPPKKTEPERSTVPRLLPNFTAPEPPVLRQEFEGPHLEKSNFALESTTLRVHRAAGAAPNYATLAEALAAAPADRHTIIEIDDHGPHFIPSLSPMKDRHLTIRGSKGFEQKRPLLAWDLPASPARATNRRWLSLEKGSLTLENLELTVRWQELLTSEWAAMIEVTGGQLTATNCTFALSGRHGPGVSALRLVTGEVPARCQVRNCYFRGTDLTAVSVRGSGSDVLLENTLALTSGQQPLVRIASSDGGIVRLVRSTLCAAKTLLQVQPQAGVEGTGSVRFLCCDALLAQADPTAEGNMLSLVDVPTSRVTWRAVNTLYTGWRLLLGGAKVVAGSALTTWREEWRYTDGDKTQSETWPKVFRPQPEELPPDLAQTSGTALHYEALSKPGPLGCDSAGLPSCRTNWLALTFDRRPLTSVMLPAPGEPPAIPQAPDDRYSGERLTLTKGLDLGAHLKEKLARSGPRVVLHLSGTGEFPTSPLVLKGADLVIYCEKPAPKAEPLTLVADNDTSGGKPALIEVDGGNCELIHLRLKVTATTQFTPTPRRAVRVRGGRLALLNCHLHGPLTLIPDSYLALVEVAGSGKEAAEPAEAAIAQSVLVSGKNVLLLGKTDVNCRLKGSLVVAHDDLLCLELGNCGPAPGVQCLLENNTLALRRGLVCVRSSGENLVREPVLIQADSNLILDPFGEAPHQSVLLRCEAGQLGRGLLLWQGRGNGFDRKHLHAFIGPSLTQPSPGQKLEDWQKLWGSLGEQQAKPFDMDKWTFKVRDLPLQQLGLPLAVRATLGPTPPGANLDLLGLPKKK